MQKRGRADEEVVIRKDVQDRQEKVRDKVREMRVDMEKGGETGRGEARR